MAKFNQLAWKSPLITQDFPSPIFLLVLDSIQLSIQHQNSSPTPQPPLHTTTTTNHSSFSKSQQKPVFQLAKLAGKKGGGGGGWGVGDEERAKSMLLAFQRDDSTGFTERPGRSQRHGETGENSCTFVFSSPCLRFSSARLRMCLSLGAHSFLPLRARGL